MGQNGTPMKLTLRQAAEQVVASKSSISRALKSGRLSADRDDKGAWAIDPAELFRVFDPIKAGPDRDTSETRSMGRAGPPSGTAPDRPGTDALEAHIEGLKAQLELMREQLGDTKQDRDHWRDQAKVANQLLTDLRPSKPIGFFARLRGRAA